MNFSQILRLGEKSVDRKIVDLFISYYFAVQFFFFIGVVVLPELQINLSYIPVPISSSNRYHPTIIIYIFFFFGFSNHRSESPIIKYLNFNNLIKFCQISLFTDVRIRTCLLSTAEIANTRSMSGHRHTQKQIIPTHRKNL